jgi:hypothetical protein
LPSGRNASIRIHDALLRHCTFNKGDASFLTELKRPGSETPLLKGSEGGKSVAPTPSFFELGFEGAEVYFMVKKMVQRMLEDAGQQLGFEVHRKESQAGVDSPSAGHDLPPICLPFASTYCLQMVRLTGRLRGVFLQLRYASQVRALTAHVPIDSSVLV